MGAMAEGADEAHDKAGAADGREAIEDLPLEPKEIGYVVFSGFCMGTADVVPGVSGGTMALALGIYQRLLAAITSINKDSIQALLKFRIRDVLRIVHVKFIAALAAGIMSAVLIMVLIFKLPHLVEHQPKYVYSVFLGLVLASALVLARRIPTWNAGRVVSMLAGAGIGFGVVNLVPVATPENAPFVFLCGVIAISAMLLPGISGSFLLLILGKYAYVLNSISALAKGDLGALGIIVPFALGCLVGITAFSRLLGWLLRKWQHTVMALMTGLLLGSLWRIWPYQHLTTEIIRKKPRVIASEPYWPESLEISVIALFAAGLAAVVFIEWVAARRAAAQ